MLLSIQFHFLFMTFERLVHDGGLNRIGILDDTVILVRFQIRAIEEVFHLLILCFKICVFYAIFTINITYFIMRPSQLTRLPRPLISLIIHKTFQITFELIVHFDSALFDFFRADEWEVCILISHFVANFTFFLLLLFRECVEIRFIHLNQLLLFHLFLFVCFLFIN